MTSTAFATFIFSSSTYLYQLTPHEFMYFRVPLWNFFFFSNFCYMFFFTLLSSYLLAFSTSQMCMELLYLLTRGSRQHSQRHCHYSHRYSNKHYRIYACMFIYLILKYMCLYAHMLIYSEELSYDLVLTVFWTRFFLLYTSFFFALYFLYFLFFKFFFLRLKFFFCFYFVIK